jgi:indolepyruvate ferredoxin oxidoreductase beta subunit
MKRDILIAGVGGQGILTIATILGRAALDAGLHLKQSEVHGMAQRGGSVQSHMRYADGAVHSDLIPRGKADILLSMEPMEAIRYLAWLAPGGWLVANETPVENMPQYPDLATVHREIRQVDNHVLFDATRVAAAAGSPRSVNVAMLGAAAPFTGLPAEALEAAIRRQFARKGDEVAEANVKVFLAARAVAEQKKSA